MKNNLPRFCLAAALSCFCAGTVHAQSFAMNRQLTSASAGRVGGGSQQPPLSAASHLVNSKEQNNKMADVPVQGRVSSENGEPLPGVTVVVKGTNVGTTSGADGNFTINVPDGKGTLVFSFIGFLTQEVAINNRTTLSVTLAADAKALEEVVVIGYGTEKKVNLTGAVSTLGMKQKENMPITNASQALHGVGGVWVNQAGGKPGQDAGSIRIRGVGTTNNSNPLVLVDGIEYNMNDINPATIETITVLKDASAAIYGSRAANGVILVTTKGGKKGKTEVNYSFSHGIQRATFIPDAVWDPILYMQSKNQALRNEGKTTVDYSDAQIEEYRNGMATNPYAYPNRNYFDEIIKNGYLQQHNLRFSGGSDKMVYSLALGYMDQDGIFIAANHANRYSIDLNATANVTEKVKVGATIKSMYRKYTEPAQGTEAFVNRFFRALPIFASYLEDGRYGNTVFTTPGQNAIANPHMMLKEGLNEHASVRTLAKVFADISLPFNLTYSANLGVDKLDGASDDLNGASRQFNPYMTTYHPLTKVPNFFNPTPYSYVYNQNNLNLSAYHTLSWNQKLAEVHNLSAMGGMSYTKFNTSYSSSQVFGYFDNTLTDINAGSINPQVSGRRTEDVLLSYFGRVGYDYKEKYLLDATIRRDGSSRFDRGNRWGTYYGVSAGWRIDQEAFFKNIGGLSFVDLFKIRASYGELGNQAVPLYSYAPTVNLGFDYAFNNTIAAGAAVTNAVDPEIHWETTNTYDVGADFSAWNGRLNLSFDVFKKRTTDILRQVNIPAQVGGLTGPQSNIGVVDNDGYDISLSHRNTIGHFKYEVAGEFGYVKNEVVDLNGARQVGTRRITTEGYPIDSYYLYEVEGIYQTQDEVNSSAKISNAVRPGYLKYKDQNNDGKINGDDRIITGSTIPKYTYGFNLGVSYKDISLSSFFQGIQGVDLYPTANLATPFNNGAGVTHEWLNNAWTPENPNAKFPILTTSTGATENFQPSTFWLRDGSYLRLKNIQLKYNLPISLISKIRLSNLGVFVNGENILTFTKFRDFDPEKNITQDNFYEYPSVKTFSFGINATF
ncbi:SusC/RagA family TonB-linked outer membrane protein [Adhaeribacter aerolatus]|uniref:SusC/RagA family TonB-linked outer membrane protein n=1 Tax=Adhaeribacter aerolatus TaxID=670289 RepID=A0A512B5L7_9BACT|nr:TonB-dependent receptor [Adhaeribacter aerolatus]GEO07258.1 SusC/RagA family TonB-linked outer membrane protein [Adhaeribacter aerolatus]